MKCHGTFPEEQMRMFGDYVWACFRHEKQEAMDRWAKKVLPPKEPPRKYETAEDFLIPIDQRRCPPEWYAFSFDASAPFRPKEKKKKEQQR